MAAMGLSASAKCRTIAMTSAFNRRYSGARPPDTTNASYAAASTSANVAFKPKLCPGFSLYVWSPSKS